MTKARDLANAGTALTSVSATELGYLDGVTSAVQTQMDAKLASSTAATTYVANSLADAKGDLFVASADNTVTRLPVGSTGDTIVADSSTATGLRYQGSMAAGRNFCINGGMDIWQRGTTFTATANLTYLADRWFNSTGTSLTVTRDTDVPTSPYFQYSMKLVGSSDNSVSMRIESANSTLLAGQTVTFSFYAKRTSGAGALDVRFYYPSATDNFASNTQIGSTVVVSASPSSSWTRYSVTAAIGTNITTGLQILINNTGAATTFITGAQLELGSVATAFSRATGTIQGELAACQRYYFRATASSAFTPFGVGAAYASTGAQLVVNHPVSMRIGPSAMEYANLAVTTASGSLSVPTTLTFTNTGPLASMLATANASGLVAGDSTLLVANVTTSAFLGFSAEL